MLNVDDCDLTLADLEDGGRIVSGPFHSPEYRFHSLGRTTAVPALPEPPDQLPDTVFVILRVVSISTAHQNKVEDLHFQTVTADPRFAVESAVLAGALSQPSL